MKFNAFFCMAALTVSFSQGVIADTSSKHIALSNNYAGNSWRQAMLASWKQNGNAAVKAGVVSAADSFTTSENQATEQAAQIQNMILQGYDAIVVDASSPTAINGAVAEACKAGIVVVSFDGIVTEPCAWRVKVDFRKFGQQQVDYLVKHMPKGGNLLEVRGLAGVFVDDEIHAGLINGLKAHPQFKIVGSVNGNWAQDVAQKAVAGVLPSLPQIDAVVTQGGDGYGTAQAFEATKRKMPLIFMGNRQDELKWWEQQKEQNGYKTISFGVAPGISTLAFWVAQQILDGKNVPKELDVPFLTVNQNDLKKVLSTTAKGSVANKEYTLADTLKVIDAAKAKNGNANAK